MAAISIGRPEAQLLEGGGRAERLLLHTAPASERLQGGLDQRAAALVGVLELLGLRDRRARVCV